MSGLTGYTVGSQGGLDLSGIFEPWSSGSNPDTGYTVGSQGGLDLSGIFQAYNGLGNKALATQYIVNNNNYDANTDLSDIFAPLSFNTNGIISNTNPFVTSAPTNGYTYILFNSTTTSYYFKTNITIPNLYYMIVGTGGTGQPGSANGEIPGAGGGAGGCWNYFINNFSLSNYTITIPTINTGLSTQITDGSFSLTAQSGQYVQRGYVNLNGTDLSPASSIANEQGVGGSGSQNIGSAPGGSVYSGNHLTFLGDGLVSNTFFGGGGGSGAGNMVPDTNANGGDGGGGGGGGGYSFVYEFGTGGIGTNGNNGIIGSIIAPKGGNAFNSIGQGYGGGGGGGGGGDVGGNGGNGGGAVLLLYFIPITYNIIIQNGGTSVISGLYTIVSFINTGTNGSISINSTVQNTFYYLVVAGGGSGGSYQGGGGGGGGVLQGNFIVYGSSNIITINTNVGIGGTGNGVYGSYGTGGTNSTISLDNDIQYTSIGGGRGGYVNDVGSVGNGGSGGGGAAYGNSPAIKPLGGTGTSGQGYNGGVGAWSTVGNNGGGGGGGGGGDGAGVTVNQQGGNGGIGALCTQIGISLIYTYLGGGGGGGGSNVAGIGGQGGGGAGGAVSGNSGTFQYTATSGTANTGGGGGGGEGTAGLGASGGSGIVVIAYLTPPP
jgi:hypothetical protein